MIRVEDVGADRLERVNKILSRVPGGAIRASAAAMKRAGSTAKTKAGQFAAAEYTISKGTFMANVNMKTDMSGGAGGVASLNIMFAGSVLPLKTFQTRALKNGGVTAKVKRSGGGGRLEHAFRIDAFGGGIFERVGAPRFPVEQKYGPSTAHMMQDEKVVQQMDKTITETFDKRIEHEILRILNGG